MTFPFFDAPAREPSSFVGFADNRIDRQSEFRADEAAETALADPAARLMVMGEGRILLASNGQGFGPWYDVAGARTLGARLEDAVLLGWSPAGPVLAAPSATAREDLPEAVKAIDYRSVYIQGLIDEEALGALAQGAALLAWHANQRFCGTCGAATAMRGGGCQRQCTGCGRSHFPRTDPVVIMLAVAGEKCLLGRSPHFAPGMYSCLAGFLEPGETIENAVRRETLEEAGIRLGRVTYRASQPWPFPHTLMIGCYGEALDEAIRTDERELEDCRWFSRAEIRAVLAGNHEDGVTCPPPGAIASHLIGAWAEYG